MLECSINVFIDQKCDDCSREYSDDGHEKTFVESMQAFCLESLLYYIACG